MQGPNNRKKKKGICYYWHEQSPRNIWMASPMALENTHLKCRKLSFKCKLVHTTLPAWLLHAHGKEITYPTNQIKNFLKSLFSLRQVSLSPWWLFQALHWIYLVLVFLQMFYHCWHWILSILFLVTPTLKLSATAMQVYTPQHKVYTVSTALWHSRGQNAGIKKLLIMKKMSLQRRSFEAGMWAEMYKPYSYKSQTYQVQTCWPRQLFCHTNSRNG